MADVEENVLETEDDPIAWFAMIPHLVDDLGLSAYAYRLYGHIRRVVGEQGGGQCYQSTSTLANHCNMSAGTISKVKRELEQAGLLRIELEQRNGTRYHLITIVNIWQRNWDHMQARSPGESARSPGESARSPGERKNNPSKKNPVKKNKHRAQAPDPLPYNLDAWLEFVKDGQGQAGGMVARLGRMFQTMYPEYKVDYGRIGKAVKRVGGARRLAHLCWQSAAYRVTGDPVDYCEGLHKGTAKDGKSTQQKNEEVLAEWLAERTG